MHNATGCAAGAPATDPCPRCDVLLGLDGVQVMAVERDDGRLRVTVQTPWRLMGCPRCLVPGLMEALNPGEDESHGSTEEVPGGASGAGGPDGGGRAA